MVGSALALSLLGIGAVKALPAGKPVEERQGVWIGDGSSIFVPGQGELPLCLTNIPLKQQKPCLLPPVPGQIEPSTKKQRQFAIGDGSGVFIPGDGNLPVCAVDIPLNQQPPCMLPPITGGLEPSTKKKRQFVIGEPSETFVPGQGSLPQCAVDIPLNQQPPCILPPIVGGLQPSTKKKRQFVIGDPSSGGISVLGEGSLPVCAVDIPLNEQPPCMLPPIVGGIEPPTLPPNQKRAFVLPPDAASNPKKVIETLELQLIKLQNKKNKTQEDLEDIEAIKVALKYLAGITISAPPGTGSTFTPGKRGFVLPADATTNAKKVIETLELELIRLQNKKHKSKEDVDDIEAIKAALKYLAGITNISAPPGTGSTFTLGKRYVNLDAVGTYATVCPNLEGAETALQVLMHKDHPTVEERTIMQKLAAFLKGCGITIVKSPDGTFTIIKPSDKKKRNTAAPQFDLTGLQAAYAALLKAASDVSPSTPSFANWLALQQISGLLEIYGAAPASLAVSSASHPKRQTGTITIGLKTCQLADVMGLRAALAALLTAYGPPATAPANIFLIEQVLVSAIQLCGQPVAGWTTIIPGTPIPGGPMIPDPTQPGGWLVPDPTVPGGEMKPSTRKTRAAPAPVGDPQALLEALKVLEQAYGTYGSGKIPVPVWLVMVNVVTILQSIPGVVVEGWPVLGQGSVVLTPST
ncbi:hypothetical protein VTI74DRAFT_6804 [Chaetomium olivicolor]